MALTQGELPYSVLVGTEEKPTWSETAIGFASFYHLLSMGKTVKEAVDGMKAASGNPHFMIVNGEEVQQIREGVMKMTPTELVAFRATMGLPFPSAGQSAERESKGENHGCQTACESLQPPITR